MVRLRFCSLLTFLHLFLAITTAISNEKLTSRMISDNGIITLTNSNYKRILSTHRDSYIVLFFTATNPGIGCSMCHEFGSDYETITKSWLHDHPQGISTENDSCGIFFAIVDFQPSKTNEIFAHYKINNVPRLFILPPGNDMNNYELLNLPQESGMVRIRTIINDIKRVTGFSNFVLHEPIKVGSILVTALGTGIIVFLVRKYTDMVVSVLKFKPLWGIGSVCFILTLISGSMFNKIRGSQYAGMSSDGSHVVYFMERQQQNQFSIETQIVACMYGVLSIALIGLIQLVPKIGEYYDACRKGTKSSLAKLFVAFLLNSIIYIFYCGLTAIFKLKSPDYPFKLFKSSFY